MFLESSHSGNFSCWNWRWRGRSAIHQDWRRL